VRVRAVRAISRSQLPRRAFLTLPALALPAFAAHAATVAEPLGFPNGVTFVTSGPAHGYISGWAKLLAPHLLAGLPSDVASQFADMGGPDGVTVSNAFGGRIAPDGSTMMFTPGAALLAWLEGDSRVTYDPGHWIATVAGVAPAVMLGIKPLDGPRVSGAPLRLGAANPIGPELAGFLALELLGVPTVPVFGLSEPASLIQALRRGVIDLAFVSAPKMHDVLQSAALYGVQPLFATGVLAVDGLTSRDPQLPAVPTFVEVAAGFGVALTPGDRLTAYQAAAAAAGLCFAAVLPDLVRPSTLAEWRRGADEISDSLSVSAVTTTQGLILATGTAAAVLLTQITGSVAAVSSLRRTMLQHYGWRPS
jgi:hypothetical protein